MAIAAIAVIFITLNLVRISNVPVTYDEALTYKLYFHSSYKAIINYEISLANNHILNTICTKFLLSNVCDNVFFLRFMNLLAQINFLVFSFLVTRLLFKNKILVVGGFLLLNLNPFLFEFWGLCRGYGLSISLMMSSIYFLLAYARKNNPGLLCVCSLFSIAAVYSNFALLNFFVALIPAVAIRHFFRGQRTIPRSQLFTEALILGTASIILLMLLKEPVKRMLEDNQLYYGGDKGFFSDTVRSLVSDCFYIDIHSRLISAISYSFAGSIIIIVAFILRANWKDGTNVLFANVLLLLFATSVFSTEIQHILFNTKFLISRTALFFIPIYLLLVLALIDMLTPGITKAFLGLFLVLALGNFCRNFNINQTKTWQFDRYDLQVMKRMEGSFHGNKITVGAFFLFGEALNYYANTSFRTHFAEIEKMIEYQRSDTIFDYYYILMKDLPNKPSNYRIDTIYEKKYVLLARKSK